MHIECFDHIHPYSFPKSSQVYPLSFHPSHPQILYFLNNPLSKICAAQVLIGVVRSTRATTTDQWPHFWRKWILFQQASINNSFLPRGGSSWLPIYHAGKLVSWPLYGSQPQMWWIYWFIFLPCPEDTGPFKPLECYLSRLFLSYGGKRISYKCSIYIRSINTQICILCILTILSFSINCSPKKFL